MASLPPLVHSIIDGAPVSRRGDAPTLPIIDPASGQAISTLQSADVAEVDAAVQAARASFEGGAWSRRPVAGRQETLRAIQATLLAHADELAWLECRDTGLPMRDIRGRHVPRMAANFAWAADSTGSRSGEVYDQAPGYLTLVGDAPAGVCALLAPWNAPLALASMKVASAIATGNSCVLKPSEHTPLALPRFVELLHQAGLPPGVVNLVNGPGAATGAALAGHAGIDRIAFTGGTATGRSIMGAAAANLTPVLLELGGKSANIICASANLERALDGALLGIFSNNGQQCLAGSRILLERRIADAFIEGFCARAQRIRVGDPQAPDTEIGPLAYREHFERVLSYVDIARGDGDQLLTGGTPLEGDGFFMAPTAVLAADSHSRCAQEEIFGPFATVMVFDDIDEAVALANDTRFGLAAYLWCDHMPTVLELRERLRAGTLWINTPMMRDVRAPFGGIGDSGFGRSGGLEGLRFFTDTRVSTMATDERQLGQLGGPG